MDKTFELHGRTCDVLRLNTLSHSENFYLKLFMQQRCGEKGFVLIMALSYLLIISFLVVCAFEVGILQTKMSVAAYHQMLAFEYAESGLIAGEDAISGEQDKGEGESFHASYQFNKLPIIDPCLIYYDVQSTGIFLNAKSILHSVWVVPILEKSECVVGVGREGWEEVR